jgi:hypothetical protein
MACIQRNYSVMNQPPPQTSTYRITKNTHTVANQLKRRRKE